MGPSQYSVAGNTAQVPKASARCRRCLLKGCERSYRPRHPQSRYCSEACRVAARRWRRRQASRTWRATVQGKICRREQCKRYRRRIPLVVLSEEDPVIHVEVEADLAACEGQRPAAIPEDFSIRMCERPGCYEWFVVDSEYASQRFCCSLCRRALRNVLDREARYRRRRRKGYRVRRRRSRSPPGAPR